MVKRRWPTNRYGIHNGIAHDFEMRIQIVHARRMARMERQKKYNSINSLRYILRISGP